jgi:hypothetical protein
MTKMNAQHFRSAASGPMPWNRRSACLGSCMVIALAHSAGLAQTASIPVKQRAEQWSAQKLAAPITKDPIFVYNNWSSYDELSDNIPLTEDLAMRELKEVLRLRKQGVRFDYYMMDAFWFAKDGAYRKWRTPNWRNGPDAWIKMCQQNGIRPGMWFSSNTLVKIDAAPAWRDSLNKQGTEMSFYEGGFLPDFMDALQFWYDHGIRMFKFDFVDLTVATPKAEATQTKEEIRMRNANALREALKKFRTRNADVVLEAFNGFGGDMDMTTSTPFHEPVDLRWLEVFDAQYSGDPRPSDVPEMDFWRSMDIYSDHMVRRYEQAGLPIERIDSTGFMVGKTGTIYYRGMHAWRGALILMLARGGWINTVHGNLELINNRDALWFAKVQKLYLHMLSLGRTKTFGGVPGEVQPYGFGSVDADGAIYTVVNPAQSVQQIEIPLLSQDQRPLGVGQVQFRDAGFRPRLAGNHIELGPGQMAVVGFGKYAAPAYNLGIQQDVVIPRSITPLPAEFHDAGKGVVEATVNAPAGGDLRLIMQQRSPDESLRRTWAGGPPNGTNMSKVFTLEATQNGHSLPVTINYDKVIWSGLSWAVGEIRQTDLEPGQPIQLRFTSTEKDPVKLDGKLYVVQH